MASQPVEGVFFSVVIPTLNCADLVGRAVQSVLDQSVSDVEILVVDDGPDEATRRAVEGLNDSRVVYLPQGHAGVSVARNRGAAAARGRLLTFLDSDDEALPGWLSALARELADPAVGAVCCGLRIRRDAGEEVLLPRPRGPEFAFQTVEFLAGSFAVRREVFHAVGGYSEALAFSENTELGLRLVAHCRAHGLRVAAVPEPLIRYHAREEDPVRRSRESLQGRLAASEYILEHHGETLARSPEVHARFLATAGVRAARLGRYAQARALWRRAAEADVAPWRHYARIAATRLPPLARRVWAPGTPTTPEPA